MTLEEIKEAVSTGKVVCWKNEGYEVQYHPQGGWSIVFSSNKNSIGLTWTDGVTMNGEPEDFFIKE